MTTRGVAVLYLSLGGIAFCSWIFSDHHTKFTFIPLAVVLGGLTLLLKGIFLFRKSSEGLGLSYQQIADLSDPSNRKNLPSITTQAAQVVQDFGTGSFLVWTLLNLGKDIDQSWSNPRFSVYFSLAQSSSSLAGSSVVWLRTR
jgi:hypothetical protein